MVSDITLYDTVECLTFEVWSIFTTVDLRFCSLGGVLLQQVNLNRQNIDSSAYALIITYHSKA